MASGSDGEGVVIQASRRTPLAPTIYAAWGTMGALAMFAFIGWAFVAWQAGQINAVDENLRAMEVKLEVVSTRLAALEGRVATERKETSARFGDDMGGLKTRLDGLESRHRYMWDYLNRNLRGSSGSAGPRRE